MDVATVGEAPIARSLGLALLLLPLILLGGESSRLAWAQLAPPVSGPAAPGQGSPAEESPVVRPPSARSNPPATSPKSAPKPTLAQPAGKSATAKPSFPEPTPLSPAAPPLPPKSEAGKEAPPIDQELAPLLPKDLAPEMKETRLRPKRSWPVLLSAGVVMLLLTVGATVAVLRTDRPRS